MMSFDERLKCLFSFLISPSVTLVDDCSFLGFGSLSHISAGFIKDNKVEKILEKPKNCKYFGNDPKVVEEYHIATPSTG